MRRPFLPRTAADWAADPSTSTEPRARSTTPAACSPAGPRGAGRRPRGSARRSDLVEEFEEPLENAAWWIRPRNGSVDLVVEAEGGRPRDRNLGLAASRFVQPIGTYRGTVPGEDVGRLAGVLEDHVLTTAPDHYGEIVARRSFCETLGTPNSDWSTVSTILVGSTREIAGLP